MILMKNIEYIIGNENVLDKALQPYSNEAMSFLSDLSRELMKSSFIRQYPDLMALAFWCRKANLLQLKERCPEAEQRLGRGLCFHVSPGNIPINFAFSYLFGLLAGCANIVRLPDILYPQVQISCDVIADVLKKYPEIEKRTAFVHYPIDDEISSYFSAMADARVIWGGDKTIGIIRNYPCKPRCVDICFADRYSICLLNGEAILKASDAEFNNLIENFYNDTYLMDQNACSSPQLTYWLNDSNEARSKFWKALHTYAKEKYMLQASVAVDKYTKLCEDAIDHNNLSNSENRDNLLYRIELKRLEGDLTQLRGKCGYFYEYSLSNISELLPFVTEKYQTITYFGINPQELRGIVIQNHLRGIDRIVPVGKAMDIGIFWDGFDLARVLSRFIDIQ